MPPPRMPHNNRVSTSAALQTSSIWQKTIGHDPYAGNEPAPESAADTQAGEAKAKQVMDAARQQNLTDGSSRDDFIQKMYKGLKGGKRRRADLTAEVDSKQQQLEALLNEETSCSEEEFIEVDVKRESRKKDAKKKKKKDRKKRREKHSSSDDDCSSDDSSRRERSRRRKREKKSKRSKRKHRRRDDSSDSSDDESSDRHRDRKRKSTQRKEKKSRRRDDDDDRKRKSSSGKDKSRDEPPKEDFIASAEFAGTKKGYAFSSGDKGVGYYLDNKPPVDKKMRDEMLKLYQE